MWEESEWMIESTNLESVWESEEKHMNFKLLFLCIVEQTSDKRNLNK